MSDLDRDDIRAAVAAGIMTEAQAATLTSLCDARRGVRDHLSGLDEPFELFRGFNEIFIVIGLSILFAGWWGLTGLSFISDNGYLTTLLYGVLSMAAVLILARYFTLVRRMVAPSNLLAILFAVSSGQVGLGLAWALNANTPEALTLAAFLATACLAIYYVLFRVPFAMALIACGVYASSFGLITMGGQIPEDPQDLFLLSANGPFAVVTIGLGLLGFALAMWFDMSDPHRVTRRSKSAFWLHIIAAPAIVNTIALTLFTTDTSFALAVLIGFVLAMAAIAIIIDRRSFLVSGIGYMVALAFTISEGSGFIVILLLGAILVFLGAQWETIRGAMMRGLPAFPGKNRMPPWARLERETA